MKKKIKSLNKEKECNLSNRFKTVVNERKFAI